MTKKLEKLLKLQEDIKAQIKQEKKKVYKANHKLNTRRKVLFGSLLIHLMKNGYLDEDDIMKQLDDFLSRDNDRKLFDFPVPKPDKSPPISPQSSSLFEVVIDYYDPSQKIAVLKAFRSITKVSVKEAKFLIESFPISVIKTDSKNAQEIQNTLLSTGATVRLLEHKTL